MENNNPYSELLNIVSVMLAIQNLKENGEQSEHNDVQAANDKQAQEILSAIQIQFKEQNRKLEENKSLLYDIIGRLDNIEFVVNTLDFDEKGKESKK